MLTTFLLYSGCGILVDRLAMLLVRKIRERRRKARDLEPVNAVGEIVLPAPEDPRWKWSGTSMRLGTITVTSGRLLIEGKVLPRSLQANRYCAAVEEARRRRKLDAIIAKVDDVVEHAE